MRSYGQFCSIAKALDVIGDRWTLLIVRELLLRGPCRYTDLRNGLPGIATNLLAERIRELEAAGVVRREEAPPPVATTLVRLTETGAELEPVLKALGWWGIRYMRRPAETDEFRSQWFAYPVEFFLRDRHPEAPPASIELRTGADPAVVEVSGGAVSLRVGSVSAPDLVLAGHPQLIAALLTGQLTTADVAARGLEISGDTGVLDRILPDAATAYPTARLSNRPVIRPPGYPGRVGIEVRPATGRWDDFASFMVPRKPGAGGCVCMAQRNSSLGMPGRIATMRALCESQPGPGVLAYVDGEVAGWCSIAPKSTYRALVNSRTIPHVDDEDAWSVTCFVVRPGFRRRGLMHELLEGAVEHARAMGATVLEGYPAEPEGERIDQTAAYVGTVRLFEDHDFDRVQRTSGRSGGKPRWLVRREL